MQLLLFLIIGKVISIAIGLIYYKRLSVAFKITLFQVVIAAIAEIYGYYLSTSIHSNNNLWFFNLYWLFELWIVGYAAMNIVSHTRVKTVILSLLVITSIIWAANVYNQSLQLYATWGISAICITLVVVYFIVLFNNLFATQRIISDPIFWLSISVVLFFGCLLPYYGLFNYLYEKSPETLNRFFDITIALDFIRYPIIALAFYLYGRQQIAKQNIAIAD